MYKNKLFANNIATVITLYEKSQMDPFSSCPRGWVMLYDSQLRPFWYDYCNHGSVEFHQDGANDPTTNFDLHVMAVNANKDRAKFSLPPIIRISFKPSALSD
jgi:hypothetical protein